MRSVHTLASVQSHFWATSLPCLALGTPGRDICSCVSFTLPPSCSPSLHGHYPFHRYYGNSDSCPAPSSTGTGLLDFMIMHFQTFRLQPPHAPPSSGNTSCSGRAWPPIRFVSLSAVLRTSLIPNCLISRIRPYRVCVAALSWAAVLRTIRSLPVALHPVSPRRSYFPLLAGSSAKEGLSPSCARSLSSALGSDDSSQSSRRSVTFQSALPRGERRTNRACPEISTSFNPRSRVGSDRWSGIAL